ncbi:ABC transporter ATP-binding protein [Schaalia vaccimaxillae]|uniref:ABC transporter ATP-binding protein n=1 Tax=Schaalia vaccimaxillae TaxID=183916 RepID=UPI00047A8F1B|nr:ABC transporter ATP-binding protein [Schaalia vaccimaxillae]
MTTQTHESWAVRTQGLTKTFKGRTGARTVVTNLDLAIPAGCVYGFLGPNGSGKSTTMKMLLGLLAPTRGTVELLGLPLNARNRATLMARTGSLIEQPPGYGHLTGAENMRLVATMLGLDKSATDRALALVRMTEHQNRLVKTYSMGMKQRLGIAMALARSPQLLVLDEPTNGLDPAGIEEIRSLLIDLAEQGVTVMVSSHLLDEIDKMASVLGILSAGHMVFQGSRKQLMERSIPDTKIVTPHPQDVPTHIFEGLGLGAEPQTTQVPALSSHQKQPQSAVSEEGSPSSIVYTPDGLVLSGLTPDDVAEMMRRLVHAGIAVHEVKRQPQSLEDVFINLTGQEGEL